VSVPKGRMAQARRSANREPHAAAERSVANGVLGRCRVARHQEPKIVRNQMQLRYRPLVGQNSGKAGASPPEGKDAARQGSILQRPSEPPSPRARTHGLFRRSLRSLLVGALSKPAPPRLGPRPFAVPFRLMRGSPWYRVPAPRHCFSPSAALYQSKSANWLRLEQRLNASDIFGSRIGLNNYRLSPLNEQMLLFEGQNVQKSIPNGSTEPQKLRTLLKVTPALQRSD
jgi:hypothetical protein